VSELINWSKSHNGIFLCDFDKAVELMPEIKGILDEVKSLLELDESEYLIDVKVHMLMPGQFPCIPNWHYDFNPRDDQGERIKGQLSKLKMYMWVSSDPLTEYKDRETQKVYTKPCQQWCAFTQSDLHRGTVAEDHVWRCFIRIIPKAFVHSCTINTGTIRRHTQVYLDSRKFKW